jgi:hypothetical protein
MLCVHKKEGAFIEIENPLLFFHFESMLLLLKETITKPTYDLGK